MHIVALHAFRDNYIWMLHGGGHALVVDPGDAAPVLAACQQQGLELAGILVTHHHPDHTAGIAELLNARQVPVWGPAGEAIPGVEHRLHDGDTFSVPELGLRLQALHVPGHTLGHIAFYASEQGLLFCGDTLFSAGCGRLFEGTPQQMLQSLDRLAALPADTKVYCAHEYTLSNLQFASLVEPDNGDIAQYTGWCRQQRAEQRPTLPSTIRRELRVNPFLRVDQPGIGTSLTHRYGRGPRERTEAFALLRQWKDES